MSDSECNEPRSPKHANHGDKKFEFDPFALDKKYAKPELMGNFKIYFGKYKGKLFKEILDDWEYCEYIADLKDVKSNNLYLLQKYIKHEIDGPKTVVPEWARRTKKKVKQTRLS